MKASLIAPPPLKLLSSNFNVFKSNSKDQSPTSYSSISSQNSSVHSSPEDAEYIFILPPKSKDLEEEEEYDFIAGREDVCVGRGDTENNECKCSELDKEGRERG
jgi:hypothetical protein